MAKNNQSEEINSYQVSFPKAIPKLPMNSMDQLWQIIYPLNLDKFQSSWKPQKKIFKSEINQLLKMLESF